MASLVKILCRWYSTVRRLMNNWAAISGLDSPSPASWEIWVSRAVSWEGVVVWGVRLRTRSPVARSSRAARSAKRAPSERVCGQGGRSPPDRGARRLRDARAAVGDSYLLQLDTRIPVRAAPGDLIQILARA